MLRAAAILAQMRRRKDKDYYKPSREEQEVINMRAQDHT